MLFPDGSQIARVLKLVAKAATMKMLYFPSLSARNPVKRRPNKLGGTKSQFECLGNND